MEQSHITTTVKYWKFALPFIPITLLIVLTVFGCANSNVNTQVDARISIEQSDTNDTGEEHIFIVTLEEDTGDGNGFVPAVGETVSSSLTGVGSITGGTCNNNVTDNSGQCTIIVNSYVAGKATVHVSSTVDVGGSIIYVTTDGYGAHTVSNEKTWVDTLPTKPTVKIIIYSDFQCHSCDELNTEVENELIRLYVDTGKAQMEIRLLSAIGAESLLPAEAALCAADQGKFLEYSNAIFAAWRLDGKAAYSKEELLRTASELGLDIEKFSTCLESGTKRAVVEENMRAAAAIDLNALPTVFINDNKIVGKQPLQTYIDIIEQSLSENEN